LSTQVAGRGRAHRFLNLGEQLFDCQLHRIGFHVDKLKNLELSEVTINFFDRFSKILMLLVSRNDYQRVGSLFSADFDAWCPPPVQISDNALCRSTVDILQMVDFGETMFVFGFSLVHLINERLDQLMFDLSGDDQDPLIFPFKVNANFGIIPKHICDNLIQRIGVFKFASINFQLQFIAGRFVQFLNHARYFGLILCRCRNDNRVGNLVSCDISVGNQSRQRRLDNYRARFSKLVHLSRLAGATPV